ncbi:MAG: hypothetical protein P1V35_08290, partial [Planctomycetota bacterium]|nr:hypothetical protein [Planctomycetota bacterium]
MKRGILWLAWCICMCMPAWGQESEGFERFPLRVSSKLAGGGIEVDRGQGIRLKAGDSILFETRDGKVFEGRVIRVLERKAVVEPVDTKASIPLGTRGHALVPKSRFERKPDPEAVQEPDLPETAPESEVPEHEPWTRL